MSLGIKFFIIQIASLIMFSTSNIILTQMFSPYEVTIYNIAFKYFSIITIGFTILTSPFWSAITEAYVKNDLPWIKKTMKAQLIIWLILMGTSMIMLVCANLFYRIWVGSIITIPLNLSLTVCIYINIITLNNVFSTFLNGVSKIQMILTISIVITLLNIPLSVFFSRLIGITGVVIASSICLAIGAILGPIQYNKIINQRATGIWAK